MPAYPKIVLEVAPNQIFYPNIRKRFVAHLNPDVLKTGTRANFSSVSPPGSDLAYLQWVNSDEDPIQFSLILNEFGAHFEDLNPQTGHMNVEDSMSWLSLVARPVFLPSQKEQGFPPPVLLLIYGRKPIQRVRMISVAKTHEFFDRQLNTVRSSIEISLKHYRKIGF